MAQKKMTVFLSDIHLGAGNPWDWFDPETEGPKLASLCEYITERQSTKKDIKEVVLLGDVFDLWVCPHDQKPHTFEDIIKKHRKLISTIKDMAGKVRTFYVNGNHDYQVTVDDINRAFDEKVIHIGNRYRRGNILGLHGHEFALFNRPDTKNGGPRLRLPIGYYITRLHTTLGEKRAAKASLIFQIIDESFQVMGPEKLPESVLDALRDAVEMSRNITVDKFTMGHICPDQTFGAVRERYRNLYDDWRESVGFWQSTQMILSELNRLGGIADQLCRDGVRIVVMGHSHDTKMDKDWIPKRQIYANCGFWCGFGEEEKEEDNAHFVLSDGRKVELCYLKKGQMKKRKTLEL